jgi:hypothetical protein
MVDMQRIRRDVSGDDDLLLLNSRGREKDEDVEVNE